MDNHTVTVVILTWNRRDDLKETLYKLRASRYKNLEIIVVDNASTDGTDSMVLSDFPEVRYLPLDENRGIAGYNVGFKAASGDFVLVLDSDSYPAEDSIGRMVELFEKNRDVGAIAFDVHAADTDILSEENGGEQISDVAGYHGAATGFRREIFAVAGYWYEPFFLYFNEMDHALRILDAGYRIVHSTAIRAFHKSSPVSRPSERAPYFYTRNALWLIWRHYPLRQMFASTLYFIYLAVSETCFQRTTVYLKAVRDAFLSASAVLAQRRPVKRSVYDFARIPLPLVFTRRA